jgi:hypothetical protein
MLILRDGKIVKEKEGLLLNMKHEGQPEQVKQEQVKGN